MELKKFNDDGTAAFSKYLADLKDDKTLSPPTDLLGKTDLTEPLTEPIRADLRPFSDRMDFTCWLHDAAEENHSKVPQHDAGFWAWLTLLLFDQVCPAKNGTRKVGAQARYIIDSNWRRRYRHLLATPYRAFYQYCDKPARALVILSQSLDVWGELTEQIAGRQELISCPGTMSLATQLFVDPQTHDPKTGASGNAARRLGKLLNQYTRTWDITVMKPAQAEDLLPHEFDRFKISV